MATETIRKIPLGQRQLFLDDVDVAQIENLQKTMYQPDKKGAVVRPDLVRGGSLQTRTAPIWDPTEKVWKIWACGIAAEAARGDVEFWHPSYYESQDGVHWSAPAVRQMEHDDLSGINLIFFPTGDGRTGEDICVTYDPRDPEPARRYKGWTYDRRRNCLVPGASPDGITWTPLNTPSIPSFDEFNLSYDHEAALFIAAVKVNGPNGRSHALTTSNDFEHWTEPKLVFHADELAQTLARQVIAQRLANPMLQQPVSNHPEEHAVDVYNFAISRYESRYIGFASMFYHTGRAWEDRNHDGFHHVQLASSRDMRHWQRLGERKPFIGSSTLGAGAYDTMQILGPSYPIIRDDELWFYYSGLKHRWLPENPDPDRSAICLATLRRDGFVSLDADEEGGMVTTQPFHWEGERLYLNADARKGEIACEILDSTGQPLAGFSRQDCLSIAGDNVRLAVNWQRQGGMPVPSVGPIRLRISLRNARLYSYWFE